MAARDLCTRAEVTAYAPGYSDDATTNAVIERLITAESRSWYETTGREFIALDPAVATRRFDLTDWHQRHRRVRIGDVTTITAVTIEDGAGTTLETITSANYVQLPRNRDDWTPVTALAFPSDSASPVASIGRGRVLKVTASAWGFPSVPADVKEAVAAMVLFRYVSDVASAGTRLAEALASVNLGVLFANAISVRRNYRHDAPFA